MTSVWEFEPKLVGRLTEMHAEGLSFSEIAAELGHGLTRNSCIGKAKRLGLPMRRDVHDPNLPRPAKPRPDKAKHAVPSRAYRRQALESDDCYEFVCDEAIPIAQRKTFAQLKPIHCRFIYGHPSSGDFFYCGGTKYAGSYCAYHHAITHRGVAALTEFERERRRQFRINAHRIATEKERLAV